MKKCHHGPTQVVGVDYSGRLIDAALQFQDKREVDWMDGDTLWSLKLPEEVKGVPEFVVFKQVRPSLSYNHTLSNAV